MIALVCINCLNIDFNSQFDAGIKSGKLRYLE